MSPLARTRQVAACFVFFYLLTTSLSAAVTASAAGGSAAAAQNPAGSRGATASQATAGAQAPTAPPASGSATSPASGTATSPASGTAAPPGSGTASAATTPPQPQTASAPQGSQPRPVVLRTNATAQIARSALLIIEGTAATDFLQLKIRRVADGTAINGSDVTVTIDGKNAPVTREDGGTYDVPSNDLRGGGSGEAAKDVDIVVAHDGIREILSSKVAVAEPTSSGGLLGDHKQMAWWILNIAIVFIAAMALSRRKS
jgi:hypothetical protein